jgi:hypothetical protein
MLMRRAIAGMSEQERALEVDAGEEECCSSEVKVGEPKRLKMKVVPSDLAWKVRRRRLLHSILYAGEWGPEQLDPGAVPEQSRPRRQVHCTSAISRTPPSLCTTSLLSISFLFLVLPRLCTSGSDHTPRPVSNTLELSGV